MNLNSNMTLLQIYRQQLSSFQQLSKQQEADLFESYYQGNLKAKEKLIEANLKTVYIIAKTYCNGDEQLLLELIQEGNYGLTKAIDYFDLSKNVPFSSFASIYIKKFIFRFLNQNHTIRIPENVYFKLKEIKDLQQIYFIENNEMPSYAYMAEKLNKSENEIKELLSYDFVFTSIDEPLDGKDSTLADFVGEDKSEVLSDLLIEDLIDSLEDKTDQIIIKQYLGIHCKPKTFKEIGEILCITKQAVGQRYHNAIEKIRKNYDK